MEDPFDGGYYLVIREKHGEGAGRLVQVERWLWVHVADDGTVLGVRNDHEPVDMADLTLVLWKCTVPRV